MRRRRLITYGGTLVAAGLAGCSSTGDEGQTQDEQDDETTGVGDIDLSSSLPDPSVVALRHPEAQAVSLDSQNIRGDTYEFSVTVENTGNAGDIELTLVLRDSRDQPVWSPLAEEADTYQRFFSAGERRTETVTADIGNHQAYGFRLTPAEAEADVRNDGATGEVNVRLLQQGGTGDGTVLESKTVEIEAEITQTVLFSVDSDFLLEDDIDEIQFDAEATV